MKRVKYILSAVALLMLGTSSYAQSFYDGSRLVGSDLNGTARFVGMGGAMGALGGDLSVMGVNPAGIGIYRSNDASVSFGFNNFSADSKYNGTNLSVDKTRFSFDNAGFVLAIKQGDYTPLRYVNFGFNARKVKSFDRNTSAGGVYNTSQTMQFANLVNENSKFLSPDILMDQEAYFFNDVPWLGAMAYEANLLPLNADEDGYLPYYDSSRHADGVSGIYESRERGAIYSFDFNLAFNLYDRVYLGATIGAYDVDYKRTSTYSELFLVNNTEDDGDYLLENHYRVEGTGIDFKLGAIFRPFEYSPLRIGVAVSTPVYYRLTEHNMAYLDYYTFNEAEDKYMSGTAYPQNDRGGEMEGRTEYKVRTPWKYNFSLGYTVGNNLALGAEYEYMDYSGTSMKYDDGMKMLTENEKTKEYMKGVSTVRLGAEYRFVPEFSLRLGYNYIGASTKGDAYKELPLNGIRTDTEYTNSKAINNYTLGFGYRGEAFYADMAYQYQTQKADFYAFREEGLSATKMTYDRHQLLLTLGVRF